MKHSNRMARSWIATAAVVALATASCGGDDGGSGDSGSPTSGSAGTAPTDFEPTTLTLWSSFTDQQEANAFQPILERCQEELPWLTIEYVGKDELDTALSAAIEAGNPPDLVQGDFSGGLANLEAGQLIEPVNDLAERDGFDWDAFVPGGVRLVEFNGNRYGVPLSLDTAALFYNQDLLSEAGIDEPPSTQEELLDAAEKLLEVNGDGTVQRVGFVPDVGDGSFALYAGYLFGGRAISEDGTDVVISEGDAWERSLSWQKQFYDLMDPDAFQRWADGLGSYDSADNFFIKGDLALYLESSYFVTWPDRFGNGQPENWGVVPLPGPDGVADPEEQSLITSGNWFMIPTGVDDLEASWAATKCMALASDEIAGFEQVVGNIPANIEALNIFEEVEVAKIPAYQTFIDLARSPNAEVPPSSLIGSALGDELTAIALAHRRGEIADDELADELADLESRLQEELDLEVG